MRVIEYLERQPRSRLTALGLVLVVLTAMVDYKTGVEISFAIFYLLPISIVTWFAGRRAGR